jgi:CDP-diacylglycerol--glycerol-3-phosphate 3-phosphatidyltransferase
MLPDQFVAWIRQRVHIIVARTLARTPVTASALTVVGAILMGVAAWMLVHGHFLWAGITIAGASSFDVLDGALARVKGTQSTFGAFLDSTLDRYSEVLIYGGLLAYFSHISGSMLQSMLIYAVITGSILTSYIRARAESTGYSCAIGLVERPERLVILIISLCTGQIMVGLVILAALTHITAMQRFVHVWKQERHRDDEKRTHKSPTVIIKSSE